MGLRGWATRRTPSPALPAQNKNAGGIHLTGIILTLPTLPGTNRSARQDFHGYNHSALIEVLGRTSHGYNYSALIEVLGRTSPRYNYSARIEVLRTTTSWEEPSTMDAWDTRVSLASCCSWGMESTPQLHMVCRSLLSVMPTLSWRLPA